MVLINKNKYPVAEIGTHALSVKNKVIEFINSVKGKTVDAERENLPEVKRLLHQAVDYVQKNLPVGVDRVDGYMIQPILKAEADKLIVKLPKPVEEEVQEL